MRKSKFLLYTLFTLILAVLNPACNSTDKDEGASNLPQISTKPWVYWFLTDASISEKGITRDLEAMKNNGIGGAYLFTIRGAANPPLYEPPVVQLTPEWWNMMKFAVSEANRVGVKLGIHACDGFTAAGGPWITPELSMQKVVWADTVVDGNRVFKDALPQPERAENYYEDIATFAFPAPEGSDSSTNKIIPEITTSNGETADFLVKKENTKNFTSREKCWIQYKFDEPFTCRSITLQSGWNNYQANRLILETSNDGVNFISHGRLDVYRMGWDDREVTATHSIKAVKASYFRFVFDPEGSEPGAEDLDDAKWRPRLKVSGIELSGEAKINQFEGKSGAVWRLGKETNPEFIKDENCIDPGQLLDISEFIDQNGELTWDIPKGKWIILRMGHTSTGSTNYIGGGGKGLECDKLNPEAVTLQFTNWFDSIYTYVGDVIAKNTIEELYNDSWECGSQNWSPVLLDEFQKRKGYNLKELLPVMAGFPIKNVAYSEQILHDIRSTIAETLVDNYHGTMKKLAHEKGCRYSTESVAPVFVSDGMLHFKNADAPTGEFWFRSPSHDKPNDILDAISGAHVYGKQIAAAESGTEIRLDWDEHPALFKTLFDRNFALGINKVIFHVFVHDPWIDRKPGMALGVVGNFFQPNQTWWEPGKAWIQYIENCQTMLQQGIPVVDVAVFTGEEIPRRAILPDRLVPVFPGIFGEEKVNSEKTRLRNEGQPTRQMPKGVTTQKNIADPNNWIDPLNGYAYDSFNRDVLMNRAKVKNGRIELPGGASYGLLVIPGKRKMDPQAGMSVEVAKKILQLVKKGAVVYFSEKPDKLLGFEKDREVFEEIINELFEEKHMTRYSDELWSHSVGKGLVITGRYDLTNFSELGIAKDFYALENDEAAQHMAWNHRIAGNKDIYFVSNQIEKERLLEVSCRVTGKPPHLYDPLTGETHQPLAWEMHDDGRTKVQFSLAPNGSVFIIFEGNASITGYAQDPIVEMSYLLDRSTPWEVSFEKGLGGPEKPISMLDLYDWSTSKNDSVKYFSGTATYRTKFNWQGSAPTLQKVKLNLGKVANIASVKLNGKKCGIAWTYPYEVDVLDVLKSGENTLEIQVTNTWANRLMGGHELPKEERITWTNSSYRLEGNSLLKAGLLGPVSLKLQAKNQ